MNNYVLLIFLFMYLAKMILLWRHLYPSNKINLCISNNHWHWSFSLSRFFIYLQFSFKSFKLSLMSSSSWSLSPCSLCLLKIFNGARIEKEIQLFFSSVLFNIFFFPLFQIKKLNKNILMFFIPYLFNSRIILFRLCGFFAVETRPKWLICNAR